MSLADEVVGGILIAAGLAGAIRPATNMLAARANPDKNQPRVRVQQRLYLAAFLLLIADGILMATELIRQDAARWAMLVVSSVVLLSLVGWDLNAWLSSRGSHKQGDSAATSP